MADRRSGTASPTSTFVRLTGDSCLLSRLWSGAPPCSAASRCSTLARVQVLSRNERPRLWDRVAVSLAWISVLKCSLSRDAAPPAIAFGNLMFLEGRAEAIPAEDAAFNAVLACLSMMYVIDREAAAREIARVLKPGGRCCAVWTAPEQCDIVLFQQTAGRFAGPPPAPGVRVQGPSPTRAAFSGSLTLLESKLA